MKRKNLIKRELKGRTVDLSDPKRVFENLIKRELKVHARRLELLLKHDRESH